MIPSLNGNHFLRPASKPGRLTSGMFKNYFISAWRSVKRQKLASSINLLGLVVSIASCVLILLYVQHELSYDNYHLNADRIFRLTTQLNVGGKEEHTAWAPNFIGQQLKADYPEVDQLIRLQANPGKVSFNLVSPSAIPVPRVLSLDQVYTVYDPAFLTVFTFPMLEGDPQTALVQPGSVVITDKVARKFFGKDWHQGKGILGQRLQSGQNTYQITGVLRDLPSNTDMPFQVLLAQEASKLEKQAWCTSYVVFKQAVRAIGFSQKLAQVAQPIQADFAKRGGHIDFALDNLLDVHLGEPKLFDTPKANQTYLLIFSLVAGFLLLIASINYINLSLAQSVGRSREVGIRKAIGAARYQLLVQFLGESLLMTGIALILALVLVIVLLPVYNELFDLPFSVSSLVSWPMASLVGAIFVGVGVLAGSYPAFFLASFEPVKALTGKLRPGGKAASVPIGQGLLVFQFTASIMILIGTLGVYKQLHYLQDKKLGFQAEQVLVLDLPHTSTSGDLSALTKALSSLAAVQGVALIGPHSLPGQEMNVSAFNLEKDGHMLALPQRSIDVDEKYLTVLTIPLIAGRFFSSRLGEQTDQAVHEVVVNEALVAKMGWGLEAAIGKAISQGPVGAETWHGRVVGVIRNFHFQSPHKPIEPMVLQNTAQQGPEKALVHLSTGDLPVQLSLVENQWKRILPNQGFEATFLDATFARQYQQEQQLIRIFTYFSGLTILVACLGLFGLSSISTAGRTKEVGVRKVMGAQLPALIYLLSRQFLWLVGLAIVLASPLAWLAMQRWLQNFAFHVSLGPGEFILAGGIALFIAALTTSYHAVRLARTNPVRALRSD